MPVAIHWCEPPPAPLASPASGTIRALMLSRIEAYCLSVGIDENAFGWRTVNDGRFVPRLRAGIATLKLIERAEAFLDAGEPPVAPNAVDLRHSLREMRKAAGLKSDAEMASAIGLTPSKICLVMRGRRKMTVVELASAARVLGVSEADVAQALGVSFAAVTASDQASAA